jgi:hypothetical protein
VGKLRRARRPARASAAPLLASRVHTACYSSAEEAPLAAPLGRCPNRQGFRACRTSRTRGRARRRPPLPASQPCSLAPLLLPRASTYCCRRVPPSCCSRTPPHRQRQARARVPPPPPRRVAGAVRRFFFFFFSNCDWLKGTEGNTVILGPRPTCQSSQTVLI